MEALREQGNSVQHVGRVIEIWRHPVSSLAGELLAHADVSSSGIAGDRQYALIDALSGQPAAPEKDPRWRKALYLQATTTGQLPRIVFPDGQFCSFSDTTLNDRLSNYFGFPVSIAAYNSSEQKLGLRTTTNRYQPFAVHLLTTASLKRLAALRQVEAIDSRRFRPTVLIDVPQSDGFVESLWIGRDMRLGALNLTAREETKRCGMTFVPQPGIDEDPEILRTILRHNKRSLGIYCEVNSTGTIQPGDPLFID